MERRGFIRFCAAGFAAGAAPALAADAKPQLYARTLLLDEKGAPLLAKSIPPNRNLIFNYPYASTPCFLLNLGKPAQASAALRTADNHTYRWTGGVGPGRSIVAYSAICAHKLTYPTRDISFISYRAEKSPANKLAAVIHCCSEHSQYDPAEGAKVVAGPAPQPLAAILIEWDSTNDQLYAAGTQGGEGINDNNDNYEIKQKKEHGGAAKRAVSGSCVVQELEHYCRQQVKC